MDLPQDIAADVADIGRLDAVPAILNLACELTGMGFAAVARVTEQRWVAWSTKSASASSPAASWW